MLNFSLLVKDVDGAPAPLLKRLCVNLLVCAASTALAVDLTLQPLNFLVLLLRLSNELPDLILLLQQLEFHSLGSVLVTAFVSLELSFSLIQ